MCRPLGRGARGLAAAGPVPVVLRGNVPTDSRAGARVVAHDTHIAIAANTTLANQQPRQALSAIRSDNSGRHGIWGSGSGSSVNRAVWGQTSGVLHRMRAARR